MKGRYDAERHSALSNKWLELMCKTPEDGGSLSLGYPPCVLPLRTCECARPVWLLPWCWKASRQFWWAP